MHNKVIFHWQIKISLVYAGFVQIYFQYFPKYICGVEDFDIILVETQFFENYFTIF